MGGPSRFYQIRLRGGIWEPRQKISSLAKAMEVAYCMAERHNTRAYIIQTFSSVEVVDGKPVWTDRLPKA